MSCESVAYILASYGADEPYIHYDYDDLGINLHGCFMYAVLDFIAFCPSFFFIRSLQYNYFTNSMFVISLHHTCEIV